MKKRYAAKAIETIEGIVGRGNLLTGAEDMRPYLTEWRGAYQGAALCVARPASVAEVAAIVKAAAGAGLHIVPQSGNTGLVGGQIAFDAERAILLSLSRMTKIRKIDPSDNSLIAEAGCVLADIHEAAAGAGRIFPLTLASEGSCRIGGALASNAGGHNVLRYGMARDLTLGLEVVMADGRVWDGLRALNKDNTGYDLKNLFIGSEGTLGVITAAVLRLFPTPRGTATFFAGADTPEQAAEFLSIALETSGRTLTAFELMPRIGLEFTLRHIAGTRDPLPERWDWYVLGEMDSRKSENDAKEAARAILAKALERGHIGNAALAESLSQARALWRLRESMSEAQKHEGAGIKHDVSVPVASVPRFLSRAGRAVEAICPSARTVPFGHMGDGNVHFNISKPIGMADADFLALRERINEAVYDIVDSLDGSISAEHGIGVLKREALGARRSSVEMDMMKSVKKALDPKNLFNPGKLLTLK